MFGVHRGHYPDDAAALEARRPRDAARRSVLHVADAGLRAHPGAAPPGREAPGPRRIALRRARLAGASLGHFLATRGDAFSRSQFDKTFNYLAHSFAYWARALHERDLLAPGAQLLGLTNVLHDRSCTTAAWSPPPRRRWRPTCATWRSSSARSATASTCCSIGTVITPALHTVMGPQALAPGGDAPRDDPRRAHVHGRGGGALRLAADAPGRGWFNGATIDITGGMTLRLFDMVMPPD